MTLPAFTAEAATYSRATSFQFQSNFTDASPTFGSGTVTMAACPVGQRQICTTTPVTTCKCVASNGCAPSLKFCEPGICVRPNQSCP
jgi:hypothetical protein